MIASSRILRALLTLAVILALAGGSAAAAPAGLIHIKMGRLAFPSLVTLMTDLVTDRGFDRKRGIELEMVSFSSVSAFYAAQATGEVEAGVAGPHVLQRLRLEGAPLRAIATYAGLSAMVVASRNPQVKSVADLRGRSLAADMGSSEFQILAIYAKSKGIDLRRDATVVQAGPPLARAQLAAGRVDAAMSWEPTATLMLRDSSNYRIIFNGRTAWRELTGKDGWELLVSMRDDLIRRSPEAPMRLIHALQDGQQFMRTNLDETDRIVSHSMGLPPGVVKEAVLFRRIVYDIRPAWSADAAASLWEIFKVGVDQGILPRMPDQGIIYMP